MTMKRTLNLGLMGLALVAILGLALFVAPEALADDTAAETIRSGIETTGEGLFSTSSISTIVGNLIAAMLALTGIIFLVIMVYAGMLYMTAAGEEGKVKKAKSMLTTSVIGILIVVTAYAVTTYLVQALTTALG